MKLNRMRPIALLALGLMLMGGWSNSGWAKGSVPFTVPADDAACASGSDFTDEDVLKAKLKDQYGIKINPDDPDYKAIWDGVDKTCDADFFSKKSHGCSATCKVDADQLSGTQSAVGKTAVVCKANKLKGKVKEKKSGKDYKKYYKYMANYAEGRFVPIVVGPNNEMYVIDHHHLTASVQEASKDFKKSLKQKLIAVVVLNLNKDYLDKHETDATQMVDFVKKMDTSVDHKDACHGTAEGHQLQMNGMGVYWPCDIQGDDINFRSFFEGMKSNKVVDLPDDPMRTLSRWVRNSYGYIKSCDDEDKDQQRYKNCLKYMEEHGNPSPPNFLEFQWANYLRKGFSDDQLTQLRLAEPGEDQGKLMASKTFFDPAMANAISEDAKEMFGYNDGKLVTPYTSADHTMEDDGCPWVK